MRILVAGSRPWHRALYDEWTATSPHACQFVGERDRLVETADAFSPELIFFVHWSWRIPASVYERYECVAFHMSDLPFGRGGSPLQHLILMGRHDTVLTAFRVTSAFDAGPVYLKRPLELSGRAEDIYVRASKLALAMIDEIGDRRPVPVPQTGDVVEFTRRTPRDSLIPGVSGVVALYDFIRMLDAEGYPRAYLEHQGFRYELFDVALQGDRLTARVEIVRKTEGPE